MGLFSIFGAAAKEPIEAIGGALDELFTSDDERLTHQEMMVRLQQRPQLAQIAVNQVEAQHRSIFVAGWRPFIGWVCGWAIAYLWLIRSIFSDLIVSFGGPALPPLDITAVDVIALLGPLLGLGTLRTGEKLAGKAK